jgi:hypothetical protein
MPAYLRDYPAGQQVEPVKVHHLDSRREWMRHNIDVFNRDEAEAQAESDRQAAADEQKHAYANRRREGTQ